MLRSIAISGAVAAGLLAAGCAPVARAPTPAPASTPVPSGRELAEQRCGGCHAIDMTDTSRNPAAPPLRDMFRRYPVYALERAFREGLEVGHRDMPRFELTPDEVAAILSYLRELDPCAKPSTDEAAMRRCFAPI